MSTSMLYRVFGVRDYRYVKTKYIPGGVIFTMDRKAKTCCCAACGTFGRKGQSNGRFTHCLSEANR